MDIDPDNGNFFVSGKTSNPSFFQVSGRQVIAMFDQYGKYIFLKNLVDPPYKNIREGKACKFGNGTPRPLFVNAFFDNPHRFVLIKLSYAGDVIWNARVGISPMAAYWANSQAIFALDPSDGSLS